jgi:2-methylcitrate dehydratase PrpD
MKEMLLSGRLADFVSKTNYEDIPEKVLAGAKEPVSDITVNYIEAMGGNPDASVIGRNLKTSVYNAAMANGVLGHALDYDDMSASLIGHPSTVVLPAVLAMGEYRKISGRQALEAFVLGIEVSCAIGRGANPDHYQNGWHPTTSIGVFGATAAAGKILGLPVERLIHAFGIAGSESSGLRENFGTMTKPLHAGRAAAKGVLAAMLASKGFTGTGNIFEGEAGFFKAMAGNYDLEKIHKSLGNPYEVESPGLSIKPYPACGATFNGIDAMLALIKENKIAPENVKRIECGSVPIAKDVLIYPLPKTGLEGKFSMPFCLALALTEGKVALDHFTDQKVSDPAIVKLMEKTNLYVDPELAKIGYRGTFNTIVKICLNDGREYVKRLDHSKGSPENPLSENELFEKFADCAGRLLSEEKVNRSVKILKDIQQSADLTELMNTLKC